MPCHAHLINTLARVGVTPAKKQCSELSDQIKLVGSKKEAYVKCVSFGYARKCNIVSDVGDKAKRVADHLVVRSEHMIFGYIH